MLSPAERDYILKCSTIHAVGQVVRGALPMERNKISYRNDSKDGTSNPR